MGLQYRSDVDRLLVEGTDLANDCCCGECLDPVACHRFDACCDGTLFEDLLEHPHYIIISDDRYTELGDPDCVIYNGCCYCNHAESEKGYNVEPSEVTASVETNCADCFGNEGASCVTCNTCGNCDPQQPLSVIATISDIVTSSQAPNYKEELEKDHVLLWDATASASGCKYEKTWTAGGVDYEVSLNWITNNWELYVKISYLSVNTRSYQRDSGVDVQCDSVAGVYDYKLSGSAGFPSYTGVVSL